MERIDLGDEELYSHGIGCRLIRAATRFAVSLDTGITSFVDDHPRLGILNALIGIFGEENVEAQIGGTSYGMHENNALRQIFDDHPVQEGEPYLLSVITARIDPATAVTWEMPVE